VIENPNPIEDQKTKNSTSLIILTYNEIEGITALFPKIPLSMVDECFVIDGNSTDGTLEFLKSNGMRVIVQQKKGRGEAFRIASEVAKGDQLIFFGPDGNENPADIKKIMELLNQGNDMVIASRFLPAARNEEDDQTFRWRAWANRAFSFIANSIWHGHISDTINGFRGVKLEAFKLLRPDSQGYTIEYQMSIRALKLKLKVVEFPTYEGNRIGRPTTAHSITTGIKFLKLLAREIFIGKKF
jgi:glycosyltransferase involved in cell wall biosynthesis